MEQSQLVKLLNEDLSLSYRAYLQAVRNLSPVGAGTFEPLVKARLSYIAGLTLSVLDLARLIRSLEGTPTTMTAPVHERDNLQQALKEDLSLEILRCHRFEQRLTDVSHQPEMAETIANLLDTARQQVQMLRAAQNPEGEPK